MIWLFLLGVLILYILSSVLVYFLANSNIIPSRRNKEYEIDFGASLHTIPSVIDDEKQVAYWTAFQEFPENAPNVIFLHGFTRTSDTLQTRARIYWDLGYNMFFVDNLGHGYSSNLLYPSGYRYSVEVRNIIDQEDIVEPVLHGLSMGGIAANVIAQKHPNIPKAVVCEALPKDFKDLYKKLLGYLSIPHQLFPWIEWLSRKFNWKQFDELGLSEEDYNPTEVQCPMYLIHSKSDRLFDYRTHFLVIREKMKDRDNFYSWLAEDSGHTKMADHHNYEENLRSFLKIL